MPALERTAQFTQQRHKRILHNIANLSTPNFRPADLSVEEFRASLGRAIDDRRKRSGGPQGELEMRNPPHSQNQSHSIASRPSLSRDNILFHDRNDRSLEHQMQNLAENTMTHNAAIEFMKNQFNLLESTIQERA